MSQSRNPKRKDTFYELLDLESSAPEGTAILDKCFDVARLLLEKNVSYGNSALDPKRVFSSASPEEQILVRIDDKLSRIAASQEFASEDTVLDLTGYLILLMVVRGK